MGIQVHPQSSTKETPYSLVYGTDVMIPVEIGETSIRQTHFEPIPNEACMNTHLDLLVEWRERAHIQDMATKLRATRKYNSKLDPRSFHKGDLVWRLTSKARKHQEVGNDAYRLERLSGDPIPNTWNASHLKFYFS